MALKADPTTPQVAKKAAVIDEIRGKLDAADAAVLTEYRGLTVTEIARLRAALRPANTEYKIYKNTLVQRAAEEAGIGTQLGDWLTGPVAIAFVTGDAAAAAKALRDFAKVNPNLVLKGGLLGDRTMSVRDVEDLADLPSRDALLGQIAGLFEAPLRQTAGVLEALLRDTVGLLQALADQRGAHPEA
jgi:large subunit ribosomal protein L10